VAKRLRTITDLLRAPRAALKAVTKEQKLAHPENFSKGGEYLISESVNRLLSTTAYVTKSRWRDTQLGISHGKAAKLREQGRLGYGPTGEERAIPSGVITHRLRKAVARIQEFNKQATPWAKKLGHRGAGTYSINAKRAKSRDNFIEARTKFIEWRRRKLGTKKRAGEFLDDGDWHRMIDIARTLKDPMLSRLMAS
jgi:hypothetical protein